MLLPHPGLFSFNVGDDELFNTLGCPEKWKEEYSKEELHQILGELRQLIEKKKIISYYSRFSKKYIYLLLFLIAKMQKKYSWHTA